jgi:hypothetical protein
MNRYPHAPEATMGDASLDESHADVQHRRLVSREQLVGFWLVAADYREPTPGRRFRVDGPVGASAGTRARISAPKREAG